MSIYLSILNCRYRNDRIILDRTKYEYGSPIEMKEDRQERK